MERFNKIHILFALSIVAIGSIGIFTILDAEATHDVDCDVYAPPFTFVGICKLIEQNEIIIHQNEIIINQNSQLIRLQLEQSELITQMLSESTSSPIVSGSVGYSHTCFGYENGTTNCFEREK